MNSTLKHWMIGASSLVNHVVATRFPDACPFILVCEFPRSGANWIRDMIGDALQMPVPRFSLLPITFSSLVHSHFVKPARKSPVVYVVRDGRDVFVSHFHKTLNAVRSGTPAQRRRTLQLHRSMQSVAAEGSQEDGMRAFYEEWRQRPVGSRVNWGEHVSGWLNERTPNVHVVRYEDMLKSPHETLKSVAHRLGASEVDDRVIDFAVQRNSFEFKTGRMPGEVDNNQNRRSGRAGGWQESLPSDLQERFISDFGDVITLINTKR